MATAEEMLGAIDEVLTDGVRRDMLHNRAEDHQLDGRTLTVRGHRLVNFGSCSYLGLEHHPAMVAAVVDAVHRFGTQFSSSRSYISAPGYAEAEQALSVNFGRPALITSSTSLGHIAALPTLVASRDAIILDHQVHHSVYAAARHAQAQGTTLILNPHNDMRRLRRRVEELRTSHRQIWYATDGLFSMYADYAPLDALNDLMADHAQLWLYADDAHAVSWRGQHGRGYVLTDLTEQSRSRAVVCGSLNKSFAAAGGVFTFPNAELRRRVFTVGGPLMFSGPVQPPMLAAITCSAHLHRTAELRCRQQTLLDRIRLFNTLALAEGLPLVSTSEAPIRCIGAGVPAIAYDLTGRLRDAGHFVNTAVFPAVPAKLCGARVALTANHTPQDVADLVEAFARALPMALAAGGSSPAHVQRAFARHLDGRPVRLRPVPRPRTPVPGARPAPGDPLRLTTHESVGDLDTAEWDTLFAGRGAMMSSGLAVLERTFRDAPEPEHRWRFHYHLVRDGAGRPAAATFFTTALWKDDMLSTARVSRAIELQRRTDPYHLTSTMVAMGSLLTEGNHLYLNRQADWPSAVKLILAAARVQEDRAGAAAIVLRDLPYDDPDLHRLLLAEGFLRIPIYPTWIRAVDFTTDAGFLATLRKKHRYHQRTTVLAREPEFVVRVVPGGSGETLSQAEQDHLYQLYRNVHARNTELNVFPLPRRLLAAALDQPGWELVTLTLPQLGPEPVAFALQHHGTAHLQPVIVGLDYRYVASHHTYQQTLWQAIRRARHLGIPTVLYGMSADLQKSRFGATPQARWVYVQPTDTYHSAMLTQIAEGIG